MVSFSFFLDHTFNSEAYIQLQQIINDIDLIVKNFILKNFSKW